MSEKSSDSIIGEEMAMMDFERARRKEMVTMDFERARREEIATMDFVRARRKARWKGLLAAVRLQTSSLPSFDEAKRGCGFAGLARGGLRQVSLELILGTVNRSHDFDMDFNPRSAVSRERWQRVNQAHLDNISLPPVQLRKFGDDYFVLDGHHRISVAKYHGLEYIDAEVSEYVCAVEAA